MAVYIFDPNPHNITLTCPWCGTEFKPKAKNAKYCCVTCKNKAQYERTKKRNYESNKA